MSGAWVNENKYSPGKRHFIPDGVTRHQREVRERNGYRYEYFADVANGPTLCARAVYGTTHHRQASGYVCYRPDGKRAHVSGGFSVKEKVNLLQSNLCSYCRKRYIADRPELKAAVEAVQRAQVMS